MKRFTGSGTSSRLKRKFSLRFKLFIAILCVALACMITMAVLSALIGRWQVGEHFKRVEELSSQEELPLPAELPPPPPEHEARRGAQNWLVLSLVIAGALGVLLALGLSYALANRVSEPVSDLTSATQKITDGEYGSRVDVRGGEELEKLGEAFNTLSESLAKNERLRKNMIADIAHELRNPLATLQGQIEALEDGFIDMDKRTISSLKEDALMLTRLVEDLHQLSLIEAGQLKLDKMPADADRLIDGVTPKFERELQVKNVSLEIHLEKDLPPVKVDQLRIAQVLGNLIKNSLIHTPEGGTIEIGASRLRGDVVFSVADSGPGIEPDELPYVFERFYRTDKSRSRATGGAGLGLSIAKSLVEAHGGHIWAESTVGEGTTISFTVPIFSPDT